MQFEKKTELWFCFCLSLLRKITDIKQTNVCTVLKLWICANQWIYDGLMNPNFIKSIWMDNVQMESWPWYFQTSLHYIFSQLHIWLTHMFHVHLLHRWGPLRSMWQMQVWTQITVHTLFIATSRWHIFALNSLTCAYHAWIQHTQFPHWL